MGAVLIITIVVGTLLAVLYDREFFGKNVATLLVIAPFFVMPTVSALIWKNFIMHPVYGLVAFVLQKFGLHAIDWFGEYPLISVIIIIAWEWLPFAFLILFTSLKSLDQEQKEAAAIDGANSIQLFFYIIVPHLQRAIGVVVMIETIFLLSVFAEIYTTTSGGPRTRHHQPGLSGLFVGSSTIQCRYRIRWRYSRRCACEHRRLLPGQNACAKSQGPVT